MRTSDGHSPHVCAAFRLGWIMGRLYWRTLPKGDQERKNPATKLPSTGKLKETERIRADLAQVEATIRLLSEATAESKVELPSVAGARDAFGKVREEGGRDAFRLAVLKLHVDLLERLPAAEFRFGKAYDAGCAIARTSRLPAGDQLQRLRQELDGADDAAIREKWLTDTFERHRIDRISADLDDLATALPEHAGHAVARSLKAFAEQVRTVVEAPGGELIWSKVERILQRQAEMWQSLLAGEKAARESLLPRHYIDVARGWLDETRALLRSYLRMFWQPVALLVLLIVAGLVLAASGNETGGAVAGIAAVLTSLGFSWKGAGVTIGRAAQEVSRPLWNAEVEEIIAAAITLRFPSRRAAQRGVTKAPARGP